MEDTEFEGFEEEFEEQDAIYQVWALGYDANQNITDFSEKLFESSDPEVAVSFAKDYITSNKAEERAFPEDVAYLEILVETIIMVDDMESNAGNLFDDYISLKLI